MVRKFTLIFLLFLGAQHILKAQTPDTVHISLPYGTDTTCPGDQLKFVAVATNPTITVTYQWYHNNVNTGVSLDTFYTTAPADGDSVYAKIFFTWGGFPDSVQSNTIIVHRSDFIDPRVLISLIVGSNPDCPGHPLTFQAYPVNGGPTPAYQWLINGVPQLGSDSLTFTRIFSGTDTVQVRMISNSPCRTFDTAYSYKVPIVHDSLTASVSITVAHNPICSGGPDTLHATVVNAGLGWSVSWYVDSTFVPGAVGTTYVTDTLHDNAHVYCVLHAPDPCVVNHTTVSNVVIMTVIPLLDPLLSITMIHGSNPGCLDSPLTFVATYSAFGTAPSSEWYVNGISVATGTTTYTSTFANGDLLTFRMRETDGNCYTQDSVTTPAILMVRDSTPVAPLVSLIGNLLVANTMGTYAWYFNGLLVPGATGQTYHPSSLGYYYAIRTDGDCPSLPSNTIFISLLGVTEINDGDVKIYPNPTNGTLNLDWGSRTVDMKMDIYNILGQGLIHEDIAGKSHYETSLAHLPEGSYFIVLRENNGNTSTYKILLNK